MDLYLKFSSMLREIYGEYTDKIEPYGCDEAWLDVSDSSSLKGDGRKIANEISGRVKKELGITISEGISWNKIYAKPGSDYKKPDAITEFNRENYKSLIWKLPVSDLLYVGRSTNRTLSKYGIHTIGDLACTDSDFLMKQLGKMGLVIHSFANGWDESPVAPENYSALTKSIGNSTTISGHRRKYAAKQLGYRKVPVIIRVLKDDEAVVAMVESNFQREYILPSEKAFAYKMRLQAMNRQGKRKELSSDPLEPKCIKEMVEISLLEADVSENGKVNIKKTDSAGGYRSNEQLARMVGESVTQIKRYIRLTNLIPKILDMVDRELLAIRSAVEISFLTEEEQYELHAVMELEQCIPNISQANRLKRMSQQKQLDMDMIYDILQELKPNQREQVKIPFDRIGKYFPPDYTPAQQADLIEKLLKGWAHQNKKKDVQQEI